MSVLGRARLGVMYGHGTREIVDLFLPDGVPKGLVVFVHGGFWRRTGGAPWSHLAPGAGARWHAWGRCRTKSFIPALICPPHAGTPRGVARSGERGCGNKGCGRGLAQRVVLAS